MESNKKKVIESFIGTYGLNADYAVPSQADIRLKLSKNENESGLKLGSISWLVTGINIKESK